VSVPIITPIVGVSSNWLIWDSQNVDDGGGSQIASFALRLELWYGDYLPPRVDKRAPLQAVMCFGADAGTFSRAINVCVLGRRRIDILAAQLGGTGSMTFSAVAVESVSNPAGNLENSFTKTLPLNDAGATSLAVPIGFVEIASFYGNPMSLIRVTATGTLTGSAKIDLRVRAWDD